MKLRKLLFILIVLSCFSSTLFFHSAVNQTTDNITNDVPTALDAVQKPMDFTEPLVNITSHVFNLEDNVYEFVYTVKSMVADVGAVYVQTAIPDPTAYLDVMSLPGWNYGIEPIPDSEESYFCWYKDTDDDPFLPINSEGFFSFTINLDDPAYTIATGIWSISDDTGFEIGNPYPTPLDGQIQNATQFFGMIESLEFDVAPVLTVSYYPTISELPTSNSTTTYLAATTEAPTDGKYNHTKSVNTQGVTQYNTTAGSMGCAPTSLGYSLAYMGSHPNNNVAPTDGSSNPLDINNSEDMKKLIEDLIKFLKTNSSTGTSVWKFANRTNEYFENKSLPLKITTYDSDAPGHDHGKPSPKNITKEFLTEREDTQLVIKVGVKKYHSIMVVGINSTRDAHGYKIKILDPLTGKTTDTWVDSHTRDGNNQAQIWYKGKWRVVNTMFAVSPKSPKATTQASATPTADGNLHYNYHVSPVSGSGSLIDTFILETKVEPIYVDSFFDVFMPDTFEVTITENDKGFLDIIWHDNLYLGAGTTPLNTSGATFGFTCPYASMQGDWYVSHSGLPYKDDNIEDGSFNYRNQSDLGMVVVPTSLNVGESHIWSHLDIYDPDTGHISITYQITTVGEFVRSFAIQVSDPNHTNYDVAVPSGWSWYMDDITSITPELVVFDSIADGENPLELIDIQVHYMGSDTLPFLPEPGPGPWLTGNNETISADDAVDFSLGLLDSSASHFGNLNSLDRGLSQIWTVAFPALEILPQQNHSTTLFSPTIGEVLFDFEVPSLVNTTFTKGNTSDFNPYGYTQLNNTNHNTCSPTAMAYSVYWWLNNGIEGTDMSTSDYGNFTEFGKLVEELIERMGTDENGTAKSGIVGGIRDLINNHSLPLNVTTYDDAGLGGYAEHGDPNINDVINELVNKREDVHIGIRGEDWGHSMILVGINTTPDQGNWRYKCKVIDPNTGEVKETYIGISPDGTVHVYWWGDWRILDRLTAVSPTRPSVGVTATATNLADGSGISFEYNIDPEDGALVDDFHLGPLNTRLLEDQINVTQLPDGWHWKLVNTSQGWFISFYNNRTVDGHGMHLTANGTTIKFTINNRSITVGESGWSSTTTGLADPFGGTYAIPDTGRHPPAQATNGTGVEDTGTVTVPMYQEEEPSTSSTTTTTTTSTSTSTTSTSTSSSSSSSSEPAQTSYGWNISILLAVVITLSAVQIRKKNKQH